MIHIPYLLDIKASVNGGWLAIASEVSAVRISAQVMFKKTRDKKDRSPVAVYIINPPTIDRKKSMV
jgi:hypothetical protein